MSLVLPEEIVVERFLPTVRVLLARECADRGLTQSEIADHLGVTQAAVSNYLSGDPAVEARFAEDERLRRTVERIGAGFADGSMDGYEALGELVELVDAFEDRGPICAVHEEEMPALRGLGCDLCVRGRDEGVSEERRVLANVRKAARRLQEVPGAAALVPDVGTNLGMALPGATAPTDVAAIPGRVIAVRGRVTVPANPEFGASEHVAGALLAAGQVDPGVRGAVNVATDEDLLAAAREAGLDPLEVEADYEDRRARLVEAFETRGGVPTVLFHRGAYGVEPITYVFGESAVDTVDRLAALVEATR